jgi:hypothetical protein
MSLSPIERTLAIALILLSCRPPARAVSPDPKLLALVPPDTQMLAGINPAPPGNRHGRFVLITGKSAKDMDDFRSLSGSDPSRLVRQVLFAAKSGEPSAPEEHSLLVSGHFDQARIYRSAIDGGGTSTDYRGFLVVEIKPFPRDHGRVEEVRWLVVLDSSVLLFGTIASVREELDQQLAPGTPDPRLVRMLAALRSDDDAWSIVLGAKSGGIREALIALNPDLAKLADGRVLRLGIHYAHSVEFEYAVDPSSQSPPTPASQSAQPVSPEGSFSLLSSLDLHSDSDGGAQGTVKVSKDAYDHWLSKVSRHGHSGGSSAP